MRGRQGQDLQVAVGHRAAESLRGLPHRKPGIGTDDGRHHGRRIGGERRCALLDMMAEPGEQGCDLPDRCRNLEIDRIAIG